MPRFFLQRLTVLLVGFSSLVVAQTFRIENVNVITMDAPELLLNQTVLIESGKVVAVDPAGTEQVDFDGQRIAGNGGYLLPGLAEMHAHIPATRSGQAEIDKVLKLYLANGIVLARGMLGEPGHLALRESLANGERIGPELVTSGPSLNGQSVSSRQQAGKLVREQQAAGYDFIKLHPGLSRTEYQQAVKEAKRVDIQLAGHVSQEVGLELTLNSKQATIDHLDGYARGLLAEGSDALRRDPGFFGAAIAADMDFDRIEQLAIRTANQGVWNVPTETLMLHTLGNTPLQTMLDWPEMRYIDADTLSRWGNSVKSLRAEYSKQQRQRLLAMRQQLLLALQQHGAGLLLGSDAPQILNVPGFSIHRELQAMVAAGLSPAQALSMGTRNVGKFFGREGWGMLKPGSPANLVLVAENPLEDIRHTSGILGVMRQGKWHDRAQLDSWLAALTNAD